MKITFVILALLLGFHSEAFCSHTATKKRGMYVDRLEEILGNAEAEQALLEFSKMNNINYLALYGAGRYVLSHTPCDGYPLCEFIRKAKRDYGIKEVGIVVGHRLANLDGIVKHDLKRDQEGVSSQSLSQDGANVTGNFRCRYDGCGSAGVEGRPCGLCPPNPPIPVNGRQKYGWGLHLPHIFHRSLSRVHMAAFLRRILLGHRRLPWKG